MSVDRLRAGGMEGVDVGERLADRPLAIAAVRVCVAIFQQWFASGCHWVVAVLEGWVKGPAQIVLRLSSQRLTAVGQDWWCSRARSCAVSFGGVSAAAKRCRDVVLGIP